MTRKLLILLTIFVLLTVSTTPALAKKPVEPNGKGNAPQTNSPETNGPSSNAANRSPASPNSKNSILVTNTTQNVTRGNHKDGHGFDEFGYNRTARIFNGTALGWCMEKLGYDEAGCVAYLGIYAYDKLVMKWNAGWDEGNLDNWSDPSYDAWENNEWNGNVPGGSGEVWHYKIVWVGDCVDNPDLVPAGGYCIWGQFATLMDQGTADGEHSWLAHALPSGYGFYP